MFWRLVLLSVVAILAVTFGPSPASAISSRTLIAPTGAAPGDNLGYLSVASAGDVNGDGYADAIVGAYLNDVGGADAGRAYVYYGGPSADAVTDLTFTGAAAGDWFGLWVASAGDLNGDGYADVIVSAPIGGGGAGRAYVYYGGPSADAVADLTLTGAAPDDWFGRSVASAGDVNGDGYDDVVVGAYQNDAGGSDAGRAYVYYGGPSADAVADLTLTGAAPDDYFGISVASPGDVNGDGYADVIVGASSNDAGGLNAGRAYVYYGGPSADAVADLTLTGAATFDSFGDPVASAGDANGDGYADVIVGAPDNDAGGTDAGRAYVYYGGPSVDAVADLTLTGAAAGDEFGSAVASAGDVNGDGYADVIVGAHFNDAGGSNAGRAYVYYCGPSVDALADLTLTGVAVGDRFGNAVASAGDVNGDAFGDVVVGAPKNDAGGTDAGRAYVVAVYPYEVLSPNRGESWVVGEPATVRWRGHDVADLSISYDAGSSWTTLAVGVGSEEDNEFTLIAPAVPTDYALVRLTYSGQSATGSNSDASDDIFRIILPSRPPAAAGRLVMTATGLAASDAFGFAVASAGDVNGDGADDFIVGATSGDVGVAGGGGVYLYYGGAAFDGTRDLNYPSAASGEQFGYKLAAARDVNGDGYDDILVGAPFNDVIATNAGRAYLFLGGAAPDTVSDLTLSGAALEDRYGISVALLGDVNGDGYDDWMIGAYLNDSGGVDAGRAYLYLGGVVLNNTVDLTLTGAAAGDQFGVAVARGGDVNGDGYDDWLVGANKRDGVGTDAGSAYLYYGGTSLDGTADLVLNGLAAGEEFGTSTASAGDVNGDGFADLVVGAPLNDAVGTDCGRAYLYLTGAGMDAVPDLTLTGVAFGDNFGSVVAPLGDANADGYDDFLVSANTSDFTGGNKGQIYAFWGGVAPDATPDFTATGEAASDLFGTGAASAGDLTGDGFPDIVAGAYLNDAGGANAGRAYVYDIQRHHVLSPAAGTTWNVGASKSITWSGAEPADVWLSVDGGASYDLLESDAGGVETNTIALRVPHRPTKYARVQVTPSDPELAGAARSDSLFTIQSSVSLLSFDASRGAEGTTLSWATDPAVGPEGIRGYRLYHIAPGAEAGVAADGGVRIGDELIAETHYTDAAGASGSIYRLSAVNGLDEELELGRVAAGFAIRGLQVWPSPFELSSGEVLHVGLAAPVDASGHVVRDLDVGIFDAQGRRVATLTRGQDLSGGPAVPGSAISLTWNGRNASGARVSPGVYFVRATTPSAIFTMGRKVTLLP